MTKNTIRRKYRNVLRGWISGMTSLSYQHRQSCSASDRWNWPCLFNCAWIKDQLQPEIVYWVSELIGNWKGCPIATLVLLKQHDTHILLLEKDGTCWFLFVYQFILLFFCGEGWLHLLLITRPTTSLNIMCDIWLLQTRNIKFYSYLSATCYLL